ncbi:MAG TPA: hypothetical protein VFR65_03665 [Nitrososphaeraceae archaeon]|nr:hypothetical protein [Nitrososphaeraceae archaeon]
MIGLLLDKVDAEEFLTPRSNFVGQESSLSTLINNALLGEVNSNPIDSTMLDGKREEYQVIHSYQNSHSHLSFMINNALLGEVNSYPIDSISTDNVKEQFITINEDEDNNNMIFEEPKKKVERLTSTVPFILPVPFP